jgi:hypothetical protein
MGKWQVNEKTGKWIVVAAALAGVAIWNSGIFKGGVPGLPLLQISQPKLLSPEDEALTAKLQPFVKCINDVDSNLRKVVGEYRQFFEQEQQELAGTRDRLGFRQGFTGFKLKSYETDNKFSVDCLKALGEGIAMSPAEPALDGAGQTFAATLETLLPLMNTGTAYYSQKDYKDDKFKKGKELDAQMMPLFERLFAASATMREIVHVDQDKLHEHELAAMEKHSGKTFEWYALNGMFQARRAVDAIEAASKSGKLTVAAIQQPEQRMQAALDEGKAYALVHTGEKTRQGNKPLWFLLESNFDTVLTHIKELRRDVSAGEDQANISRHLATLNDRFNDLVSSYNMMGRYNR